MFGWFRKDYAKGSKLLFRADIRRVVLMQGEATGLQTSDYRRLCLSESGMRSLAYDYLDTTRIAYGANHKKKGDDDDNFPDCDDFARLAVAQIAVLGAVRAGLEYPPVFGEMAYKPHGRGMHAANWCLFMREGGPVLMVFEPQNGRFKQWSGEVDYVEAMSL